MTNPAYTKVENIRFLRNYLREIKNYPMLSREAEREIIAKAKRGDTRARSNLICANLRLVIRVATMYKGRGLDLMDLINEGNIGMIRAIQKFNPVKKVKFTSYAIWWIRQAIIQALFEKGRIVRLSAANELMIRHISRWARRNKQVIGGEYHTDSRQLGKSIGITGEFIEKLIIMDQRALSLDKPRSSEENECTLSDFIEDEQAENPSEKAYQNSLIRFIKESLQTLGPKERKVITLAFGLESNAVLNLRQMGDLLGISKERVRQIKEGSLKKLKKNAQYREYLKAA
ncbi:RNA polymerase sigma factor RpoD/SigA [Fibrobacterota bacterium]